MKNTILATCLFAFASNLGAQECLDWAPANFKIESILDMPREPGYNFWCKVKVGPDRNGWGSNQDPSLWTQIGLTIPYNATAVQLTAAPYYWGEVMSAETECNKLYVWLQYWHDAFDYFVGWQIPGYNPPPNAPMMLCDAQVYSPPSHQVCNSKNFTIVAHNLKPRLSNATVWCDFDMNENHSGWSGNEPPEEWVRIRMAIPKGALGMQATGYAADGTITKAAQSGYIINATVYCDEVYLDLEYWGQPWKLYIGWIMAAVQKSSTPNTDVCDGFVYMPSRV